MGGVMYVGFSIGRAMREQNAEDEVFRRLGPVVKNLVGSSAFSAAHLLHGSVMETVVDLAKNCLSCKGHLGPLHRIWIGRLLVIIQKTTTK
jgi:hypothetical protein